MYSVIDKSILEECVYKTSNQQLKIGDWVVVTDDALLKVVKTQDVINIKLGIKDIINPDYYQLLLKIVKINKNRVYYNQCEVIKVR